MRRLFAALLLVPLLTGCTVGPDFKRPPPPSDSRYIPAAEPSTPGDPGRGATAQTFVAGERMRADWWALFESPELNDIIRTAVARNRTIEAAQARLAAAHEAVAVVSGGLYPQVDFGASVTRQKVSTASLGLEPGKFALPPNFNVYSVGPTARFDLDIFGATRRLIEEQTARAELQAHQLNAAYLALGGNTASQSILIASWRAQLQAIDDITAIDRENLDLVRKSRDAGVAPDADVVQAESQLAADETLRPPIEQQLSQARHALAVLVGYAPGEWTVPEFDLASLVLPREIPVSLPSSLIHQRPDILAAESGVHAASAAIGVATARLYPDFTLSASASLAALQPSSLFDKSSLIWSIAAGATAPIFHGGSLEAQRKAAIADFRAAMADYEQTVLTSFAQVADLLQALVHDADLLRAQQRALDSASNSVRLQRLSYTGGGSGVLSVLDAQRQYQQARLGYVRAEAQRYLDTVQFFVAMGGGWWNAPAAQESDATPVLAR